jgi:uncharacterized protein (TIGR00369 family)
VSDVHDLPLDPASTFDSLYGLVVDEVSDGLVTGHVEVDRRVQQPFGIVHGGVHCSIAESLASIGTWFAVKDEGKLAMGLSNQTSFLRPISSGVIHGRANAVHRGRSTWVWDVEIRDDSDRVCALSRMTIAVRSPD